eukprot:5779191-Amphidinium_carterae.1
MVQLWMVWGGLGGCYRAAEVGVQTAKGTHRKQYRANKDTIASPIVNSKPFQAVKIRYCDINDSFRTNPFLTLEPGASNNEKIVQFSCCS